MVVALQIMERYYASFELSEIGQVRISRMNQKTDALLEGKPVEKLTLVAPLVGIDAITSRDLDHMARWFADEKDSDYRKKRILEETRAALAMPAITTSGILVSASPGWGQ